MDSRIHLLGRYVITPFVWLFWWVSNYGSSTKRVILVYFFWNVLWALIYLYVLPNLPNLMPDLVNTTLLSGSHLSLGSISLRPGMILAGEYTTNPSGSVHTLLHALAQYAPFLNGTTNTVLSTPDIFTAVLQTNLMIFSITNVATKDLSYLTLFCVTVHIVIGYFILAALITRLGIMFQNLSP